MTKKILFDQFSNSIYKKTLNKVNFKDKISDNFSKSILNKISDISMKTLLLLMDVCVKEKIVTGYTPAERYESFNDYSKTDDFFKIINSFYPELVNKLFITVEKMLENYESLIRRFEKDKHDLVKNFNFTVIKLSDCKIINNISDFHNGMKEVYILEYKDQKILYKPRDAFIDEAWNSILNWVNKKLEKDYLQGVKVLNRNNYSWHEYVESAHFNDEAQVIEFYKKMGCLSALTYIFDVTDLHMENIICSKTGPIILDLETMYQVIADRREDKDLNYFEEYLLNSILKTELFPCSNWNNDPYIDISGICGHGGQVINNSVFKITNAYTDEMKLEYVDGELDFQSNVPTLNGKVVNPRMYSDYILDGFTDMYLLIINNKDELLKLILNDENVKKAKLRVLLHDTQLYQDIIDFSTLPGNDSEKGRIELFGIIKNINKTESQDLVEEEFKVITKGNIPIYYTDFESKKVTTPSGKTCFYQDKSPLQQFINKLEYLDLEDLKKQKTLIELSLLKFKERFINREFSQDEMVANKLELDNELIKNEVRKIADTIISKALYSEHGYINWITVENFYPNWNIIFQNISLYSGLSGNAIFFASLYKYIKDDKYLEVLLKILDSIDDTFKRIDKSESPFTGAFSVTYLYLFLYRLGYGKSYLDKAYKLITDYEEIILSCAGYDFLDGYAGILIILINAYKIEEKEDILELINKISEIIEKSIKIINNIIFWKDEQISTGLAHGAAGLSYALGELYILKGGEKFLDLVKNLVRYENMHFNKESCNWGHIDPNDNVTKENTAIQWCHGAAGIGLSRIKINGFIDVSNDIERALKTTITMGLYKENDSICHGNFGNIDFLLSEYYKCNEDYIKEIIDYRIKEILQGMNQYRSGLSKEFESVDFMLGLSGIGYEYLRLLDSSFPIVNLLEI